MAETINPKAVTSDELYGYMTLQKDWKDGVLSIVMRGMSKNDRDLGYSQLQTSKWVVLDGDIDAIWIESMNTVMDDNKVLTLVSNERIPLSEAMRMVFEIDSLKNATPATVSRAGILYINEDDIGWRPLVESFVESLGNEQLRHYIPELFETYGVRLMDAIKGDKLKSIVPIYTISKVKTVCSLLQSFLPLWIENGKSNELLLEYFAYACVWGFGGHMCDDKQTTYRSSFCKIVHDIFETAFGGQIEEDMTCFDYYVDPTKAQGGRWTRWQVPEYVHNTIGVNPGESTFSSIYVATVDSTRITHVMSTLVNAQHPVMLVGTAGTGKSGLVNEWLGKLAREDESMLSCNIPMNYYTDSRLLQRA